MIAETFLRGSEQRIQLFDPTEVVLERVCFILKR